MKRWALIQGAQVANVVEQDDHPQISGEWVECTGLAVGPGCGWDGSAFLPPVPIVPEVSMGQAKLALLDAGKLATVEAAINALPEPQKTRALIDWNYRAFVRRDHPSVALIGGAAGLSEAEIDALFAAAALIE